MSSSKFLTAAALIPAFASAVPTLIIFDDFTATQFVGVGNGTASDTLSLANGLSRKLTVSGNRPAQTSISIDQGEAALSTPSGGSSSFSIEYTPLSGTFSLAAGGNTLASSSIALSLLSADFGSSFNWTFVDVNDNIATWFQSYNATSGSPVSYQKAFGDFSGGSSFNWSSIKKITFDATGFPNLDAIFGTGFGASYANPIPVPEPSTYGLILGGLALAGAAIRRRRQAK